MKSALTAILTIAFVSTLLGAGTLAYFSDTETSSGNTLTAGTFDININTGNSLPFKAWNIKPGWSFTETHRVQNTGSVAGEVYLTAANFVDPSTYDGGYYAEPAEPGHSVEVSPADFAKVLRIEVKADLNGDHTYEKTIYDGPLYGMETERIPIGPSGQYAWLQFRAYLPTDLDDPLTPENEDDNLYQADGVAADIVFHGTTEITIS